MIWITLQTFVFLRFVFNIFYYRLNFTPSFNLLMKSLFNSSNNSTMFLSYLDMYKVYIVMTGIFLLMDVEGSFFLLDVFNFGPRRVLITPRERCVIIVFITVMIEVQMSTHKDSFNLNACLFILKEY